MRIAIAFTMMGALSGCQGTVITTTPMGDRNSGSGDLESGDMGGDRSYGDISIGDVNVDVGDIFVGGDSTVPFPVLLAYWPLDEGIGNLAGDASGNGRAGTLSNMSDGAWVGGQFGSALSFDEVDDVIVVPDFSYGPTFSLSFWFRLPSNAGDGFKYAISHGAFDVQNNLQVFVTEEDTPNPYEVGTCLEDDDDIVDCTAIDSVLYTAAVDNSWHHYALTVDPTRGTIVYIDGMPGPIGANGGGLMDPDADFFIGGRSDLNPTRFYGGEIDDIRFHGAALTEDQVIQLFRP